MKACIVLAEKPDHGSAADLADALREHLGQPVRLDGTRVRGFGGIGAQVLLAAVRRWRADNQQIDIATSEQMLGDLQRMGLANEILGRSSGS